MNHRERYACQGADRFGDTELVALLLGTGRVGKTALQVAADLLTEFGGLGRLAAAPVPALCRQPGIGLAKAVRLHAALEVGRRAMMLPVLASEPINCPDLAHAHLSPMLKGRPFEALVGLYLNRRHRMLAMRELTRGSESLTIVDPRQIFRMGLSMGASAVILAHNHPSGDPSPSDQDRDVTTRVAQSGRVLGLRLLDHLVIAGDEYVSLAQEGVLPRWITPNELWTT